MLLFKRYYVKSESASILSNEGLTCWVVKALDVHQGNKSVALKIYRPEFAEVLAQELDTNRRLTLNDPFGWANLIVIRDTFQVADGRTGGGTCAHTHTHSHTRSIQKASYFKLRRGKIDA